MSYNPTAAVSDSLQPRLPPHIFDKICHAPKPLAATYYYDLHVVASRARLLRQTLPPWTHIYYATKANGNRAVLNALAPHIDGFDVSSSQEITDCVAAVSFDMARKDRLFVGTGPAKNDQFLIDLLRSRSIINAESELEIYRINRLARRLSITAEVALRVSPKRTMLTNSMSIGGAETVFGVAEDDVPVIIEIIHSLDSIDLVGFHFHALSNNLDVPLHVRYVNWCVQWCLEIANKCHINLRVIDCGGGLGVPFQGESSFDLELFRSGLLEIDRPSSLQIILEPGRWLVAAAGYYASEIIDLKYSSGRWFATISGGINHFRLPTTWDIPHRFNVVPIDTWNESCDRLEVASTPITVCGQLCTPEDTLVRGTLTERIRPGDIIVFPLAGAYGWELALQSFIGHPVAERITINAADYERHAKKG